MSRTNQWKGHETSIHDYTLTSVANKSTPASKHKELQNHSYDMHHKKRNHNIKKYLHTSTM